MKNKAKHVAFLSENGCYIILFALLIALTIHKWFGPDVWYHLTWGRDILKGGSPTPINRSLLEQPLIANLYWLFQSSLYLIYLVGGVVTVSLFFTLLWLAIAWLWLRLAGIVKTTEARFTYYWSPFLGPLFFLGFIVCMQLRFDQRPEIYSYFFLCALLLILNNLDLYQKLPRQKLILLFLIESVFTNCHGYFALGPMLGGALIVSVALSRATQRNLLAYKRAFAVFLVLLAGSFISPYGYEVWHLVFEYEKLGHAMRSINAEMFPTTEIALSGALQFFWFYWAVILIYAVICLVRGRRSFATLVALAGVVLGFQMLRNIPLFFIFAAPLTAALIESLETTSWTSNRLRSRLLRGSIQIVYGVTAAVILFSVATGAYFRKIGSLASPGWGLEWASYPIGAVDYLKSIQFSGKIWTDSYDGGYVEFWMPHLQISGDSYFAEPTQTLHFFDAIKNPKSLRAVDEQFHFDALLINIEDLDVLNSYWQDPAWVIGYTDSHRVVFLRSSKFAQYKVSPADGQHEHGEDLRSWIYAFAPNTWIQIALTYADTRLAKKILTELQDKPIVPSTVVRGGLVFGLIHTDPTITELALKLRGRTYETGSGDEAAIAKMAR